MSLNVIGVAIKAIRVIRHHDLWTFFRHDRCQSCCRFVDLVILGQHDPNQPLLPSDLPEQVILYSGRPVLVVPNSGTFDTVGERIVVAWNAGREAARAIRTLEKPVLCAVNGVAAIVGAGATVLRRLQTGSVRAYAGSVLVGAVMVIGYYLWR